MRGGGVCWDADCLSVTELARTPHHDGEMSEYVKIPDQLKDAVARLNGADRLIDQLRTFVQEYERQEMTRFLPFFDESSGEYKLDLPDPTAFPPPRDMKILIGDVVSSLRKSLDYLVFQLAQHNEGEEVHGTQFVVAKSAAIFRDRTGRQLKGLKDHQIEIIEQYQPYNNAEWLDLLNEMSNRDKHRTLHATFNSDYLEMHFDAKVDAENYDGWVLFENVDDHGADVYIRSIEPLVRLADGRPAVETLEVMHEGVKQVLLRFVGEFE